VTLDDDDEVDSGMNTCILIHYCVWTFLPAIFHAFCHNIKCS
jgi:hypothetical protein